MIVQDIIIYTITGAAICKTIEQPPTIADFDKLLCQSIEAGGACLDTADGKRIIINTPAVVAVEIGQPREVAPADVRGNTPPVENL